MPFTSAGGHIDALCFVHQRRAPSHTKEDDAYSCILSFSLGTFIQKQKPRRKEADHRLRCFSCPPVLFQIAHYAPLSFPVLLFLPPCVRVLVRVVTTTTAAATYGAASGARTSSLGRSLKSVRFISRVVLSHNRGKSRRGGGRGGGGGGGGRKQRVYLGHDLSLAQRRTE